MRLILSVVYTSKSKCKSLSHVWLCDHMNLWPTRLLCPWNSPGQNTGVGSHSLLQGIFQTQESSRGLLHCRQILNCPSHQERPSRERERDSFTHFLIRGHVLILKRTIVKCRDRTACQDCKADYIDCFFWIWMHVGIVLLLLAVISCY